MSKGMELWRVQIWNGRDQHRTDIQEDKVAYSIELKCSPSILNDAVDKNESISITDQIICVVIVAIVYKLFSYLLSWSEVKEG